MTLIAHRICCLLLITTCLVLARPDTYSDRYDDIHLDEIMANRQRFLTFFKCFIDQAPCTDQTKGIKGYISEALSNECAKCTDMQISNVNTLFERLINDEPELWSELMDKYDPQRKQATKLEKKFKKQHV